MKYANHASKDLQDVVNDGPLKTVIIYPFMHQSKNYIYGWNLPNPLKVLARPGGLDPPTCWLEVRGR